MEQVNSLGLDGDLDDIEMLRDLEQSFDVKFSKEETAGCVTVGDIYNVILNKYASADDNSARKEYTSAMAFYRLQEALRKYSIDSDVSSIMEISSFPGIPVKQLMRRLRQDTGLRIQKMPPTRIGIGGFLLLLATLFAAFFVHYFQPWYWVLWAVFVISGYLLIRYDPRRMPEQCRTFGDLAQKVAALNFGELAKEGADHSPDQIWNALVEVLSEHTELPKSEINPTTVCLKKNLLAA